MICENVFFIAIGFSYLFLNLINGIPIDKINIFSIILSIFSATLVKNYK